MGFLGASWGGEWKIANWIFWLLSITIGSLLYMMVLSLPNIYQSISPYPLYMPLTPSMGMNSPASNPTLMATDTVSPSRKMIYAF